MQQWGQPDANAMATSAGLGAVGQVCHGLSACHVRAAAKFRTQSPYQTYAATPQDITMDVQGLSSRKHTRSWDMTPGEHIGGLTTAACAHGPFLGQGDIEVSSTMYFTLQGKS